MTSIPATKSDTAEPNPSGRSRASKVRWAVAVFCAFGLAINYIDRSAISVSLPFMTQDFHLTPTEKGLILSAFSWSYALMQIPAGRLIDRFGERVMFGASVLVWSLFTAATAGVSSFAALLGLRLGLGVGEAGAYPAAAKTVSQWFPLRLRGRATSVYDSGARIGSAAATPIIALIIGLFGWRAAFICRRRTRHPVGDRLVGLVPAAGEQGRGQRRRTGDHPREPPRAEFQQPAPRRQADAHRRTVQAAHRLGHDARILLPELHDHLLPHLVPLVPGRGTRLQPAQARNLRLIPPLAAILGSWAGGLIGDYLLGRGWSLNKVRKTCLVGGMLVCSVIALAAIAPQAWQALVLMSISYAASAFTIVTIWCLPADVVDSSTVATLGRTQNFFSNIGSALSPIVIGALYGATGSSRCRCCSPRSIVVAGALCFGFLIKKVEPIRRPDLEGVAA